MWTLYCDEEINERGLRLLEFAVLNNIVLRNTQTIQKIDVAQPRWKTPHSHCLHLGGKALLIIHRTRTFPGADTGVTMTCDAELSSFSGKGKRANSAENEVFNFERLINPDVACAF